LANVLSQAEIDELLSAMASGNDEPIEAEDDVNESAVKPYDFRTANKFSKDQIRTLSFIYDNYATRISTLLSATLRTFCDFKVISVEEQSFSEFSNSMGSPVVLPIIRMAPPLEGSFLMEIMPSIAFEMINRMLGGVNRFTDVDKQFTEIEISVLECLLRKIIDPMNEAWEKIQKVSGLLDRVETSNQYAQIVSAHEPIAIITMSARIGEVSDIMHVCIPHVVIEPVAKHLVIQTWYSDQRRSLKSRNESSEVRDKIEDVELRVLGVFNDTRATVREIVSTQVGDVIKINHHISQQVTVMVEHIPKFKGFVGMKDANYAVQITEILKKDESDGNGKISGQ